jgi:hypothetical protein
VSGFFTFVHFLSSKKTVKALKTMLYKLGIYIAQKFTSRFNNCVKRALSPKTPCLVAIAEMFV